MTPPTANISYQTFTYDSGVSGGDTQKNEVPSSVITCISPAEAGKGLAVSAGFSGTVSAPTSTTGASVSLSGNQSDTTTITTFTNLSPAAQIVALGEFYNCTKYGSGQYGKPGDASAIQNSMNEMKDIASIAEKAANTAVPNTSTSAAPSAITSVDAAPAAVPSSSSGQPTAAAEVGGYALVTFQKVADGNVTGYTVSSLPGDGSDTNKGQTGVTHLISGLKAKTKYLFSVVATNAKGDSKASAASNPITALQ